MAFPAPLATIAAFVALAFALARAGIELFLQVPEALIAQPLLFAQGVGQTFRSLLAFILAAALACVTRMFS